MKQKASENYDKFARYADWKKRAFEKLHHEQTFIFDRKDAELQKDYPEVYKEHFESSRSRPVADAFRLEVNEFGELADIVRREDRQPPEAPKPAKDTIARPAVRQASETQKKEEVDPYEEETNPKRYKENFALIPRLKNDLYSDHMFVIDSKKPKLQVDPVAYDMEFKRRQVWTVAELRTFMSFLSEQPKFIYSAC